MDVVNMSSSSPMPIKPSGPVPATSAVTLKLQCQTAVIAVPHPKWDERPLLIAVKKEDAQVTKEDVLNHLKKTLAKWQLPDDVVFVNELPHTATGKLLKTQLRSQYKDYKLPSA